MDAEEKEKFEKVAREVDWLSDQIRKVRFPSFWLFMIPIMIRIGAGTIDLTKGVMALFDHSSDVGNSGTDETDLYSDSIPRNTLANDGDKIEAMYAGSFLNHATATRRLRVYFENASPIFDSTALVISAASAWVVRVSIIRVSSSVIRYAVSMTTQGAPLAAYTSAGEVTGLTLTNPNTLEITGTAAAAGAATNDIIAKLGTVSKAFAA